MRLALLIRHLHLALIKTVSKRAGAVGDGVGMPDDAGGCCVCRAVKPFDEKGARVRGVRRLGQTVRRRRERERKKERS